LDWSPVAAFTLLSPSEGAIVRPGATISVSLDIAKDLNVRAVQYYWYRDGEEPLPSHQAKPAVFAPSKGEAPFEGAITVPAEAIGRMRLLAVGEVARGRLESDEQFDEVLLVVEPASGLSGIEFASERPWRLDHLGQLLELPVLGQFQDGVMRPLSGREAGSRFRTSDPRVVVIDDLGIVQVMGNGRAELTVENRGQVGRLEVIVEADAAPNRPPVAVIERELQAKSGGLVVLDGIKSFDPDGDQLRYEWRQLRGHRVALTNVDEVKTSFKAPKVAERKRLQFSLTVIDMSGPDTIRGAMSRPAMVTVWVNP
jgi:hypothetical protein